MKAVGNFGGSLASITSKEKKNIKSIAKSGWIFCFYVFISRKCFYRENIMSTQIISVKEKVKDKTKKNSSSLKLVRPTFIKMTMTMMIKKENVSSILNLMRSILMSVAVEQTSHHISTNMAKI